MASGKMVRGILQPIVEKLTVRREVNILKGSVRRLALLTALHGSLQVVYEVHVSKYDCRKALLVFFTCAVTETGVFSAAGTTTNTFYATT